LLENRILGLDLRNPRKAFALLFQGREFLPLFDALSFGIIDETLGLKPPLLNGCRGSNGALLNFEWVM
jgi:hypothetical protein